MTPLSKSYKRRCVACQHTLNDQTLQMKARAGEEDSVYLLSSPDGVACECQEEESIGMLPLDPTGDLLQPPDSYFQAFWLSSIPVSASVL